MPGIAFLTSQNGLALTLMLVGLILASLARGFSGFGFSALIIAASGVVTNPLNFVAVVVIRPASAPQDAPEPERAAEPEPEPAPLLG